MKSVIKKIIIAILTLEAKYTLKKYKPKIVAVTGSVGKTSTKDAIFTALSTNFHVRKSMKSYNSDIGIPLTILGLPNGWSNYKVWLSNIWKGFQIIVKKNEYPEWLVLEVGADRPGDIEKVAKWIRPDISVITKIGKVPVHIEFYKSVDEVIKEKSNLVKYLKSEGTLIINSDDEDVVNLKSLTSAKYLSYGMENKSDVFASFPSVMYDENSFPKGMSIKVDIDGNSVPVLILRALGRQHVYPVLAAFAVGKALNLNLLKLAEAFKDHEPPVGRMNIIKGKNNTIILDDTYNSSPLALEEGINVMKSLETKGRKIAILGDMLELGKHSVDEHKRLGDMAVKVFDKVIAVGLRARDFVSSALVKKTTAKKVFHFSSSKETCENIDDKIKEGDIIYIKGSQGARMERVVERLMQNPEKKSELLVRQEEEWLSRD